MDTLLFDSLREFVKPHYIDKDDLHNMDHVQRILAEARMLSEDLDLDDDLLVFGAYLHGLILNSEAEVRTFLFNLGLDRDRVIQVMNVSWEAGKEAQPETKEGACLHDAHLIECGKEYQTAKHFIAGALQGQHLPQILDFIETRVVGRYSCSLPAAQEKHKEIEEYRSNFVKEIREALTKRTKDEADTARPEEDKADAPKKDAQK
ncbi:MAG: hypothetical protein ACLFUS_13185 [Candidatus Sumerlaeia bacterium]